MTRIEIPGGVYADALPTGAYVCPVMDTHVETDRGRVPLPPGGTPLFTRLAPDGIRFAGGAHHSDRVQEWVGDHYEDRGAWYGTNGVIYDHAGVLYLAGPDTWRETGSQGWRYVDDDGRFVTADSTYADPTRRIWEYTTTGGVTIGQTDNTIHDGGTIVLIEGHPPRVLESGECRFIRVHRDGDQFAVAISKLREGTAVLYWLTRDELLALPLMPPNNEPVESDNPKPEDPPVSLPDFEPRHSDLLRRFALRFHPPGNDDENRLWTRKLAEQFNFSFVGENWGHKRAGEGRPPSTDAIARFFGEHLVGYDLLLAGKQLILDPEPIDLQGQVFIPVEQINHLEASEDPVDDPPDAELISVLREILDGQRQLRSDFALLQGNFDAYARDSHNALVGVVNRLDAIDAQLERGFEGSNRFLGRFDLRPKT